jgi:hypothetical protein
MAKRTEMVDLFMTFWFAPKEPLADESIEFMRMRNVSVTADTEIENYGDGGVIDEPMIRLCGENTHLDAESDEICISLTPS